MVKLEGNNETNEAGTSEYIDAAKRVEVDKESIVDVYSNRRNLWETTIKEGAHGLLRPGAPKRAHKVSRGNVLKDLSFLSPEARGVVDGFSADKIKKLPQEEPSPPKENDSNSDPPGEIDDNHSPKVIESQEVFSFKDDQNNKPKQTQHEQDDSDNLQQNSNETLQNTSLDAAESEALQQGQSEAPYPHTTLSEDESADALTKADNATEESHGEPRVADTSPSSSPAPDNDLAAADDHDEKLHVDNAPADAQLQTEAEIADSTEQKTAQSAQLAQHPPDAKENEEEGLDSVGLQENNLSPEKGNTEAKDVVVEDNSQEKKHAETGDTEEEEHAEEEHHKEKTGHMERHMEGEDEDTDEVHVNFEIEEDFPSDEAEEHVQDGGREEEENSKLQQSEEANEPVLQQPMCSPDVLDNGTEPASECPATSTETGKTGDSVPTLGIVGQLHDDGKKITFDLEEGPTSDNVAHAQPEDLHLSMVALGEENASDDDMSEQDYDDLWGAVDAVLGISTEMDHPDDETSPRNVCATQEKAKRDLEDEASTPDAEQQLTRSAGSSNQNTDDAKDATSTSKGDNDEQETDDNDDLAASVARMAAELAEKTRMEADAVAKMVAELADKTRMEANAAEAQFSNQITGEDGYIERAQIEALLDSKLLAESLDSDPAEASSPVGKMPGKPESVQGENPGTDLKDTSLPQTLESAVETSGGAGNVNSGQVDEVVADSPKQSDSDVDVQKDGSHETKTEKQSEELVCQAPLGEVVVVRENVEMEQVNDVVSKTAAAQGSNRELSTVELNTLGRNIVETLKKEKSNNSDALQDNGASLAHPYAANENFGQLPNVLAKTVSNTRPKMQEPFHGQKSQWIEDQLQKPQTDHGLSKECGLATTLFLKGQMSGAKETESELESLGLTTVPAASHRGMPESSPYINTPRSIGQTPNDVRASGIIMTRLSLRTLVLRKWKESFWAQFGPASLVIFKSAQDCCRWKEAGSPFDLGDTDKQKEFNVKFHVNFYIEISKPSIRGYRMTEVAAKAYSNNGPMMHQFKLQRWADVGPSIAAAFASTDRQEVETLRTAIASCLSRCPSHGLRSIQDLLVDQKSAKNLSLSSTTPTK